LQLVFNYPSLAYTDSNKKKMAHICLYNPTTNWTVKHQWKKRQRENY